MSKDESSRMNGDDFGNVTLLRDIEEISKALYLHDTQSKALISPQYHQPKSTGETHLIERKSKYVNENLLQNVKKSSIWNWKKPLKALTHIRYHRLSCYFFLRIHSIEGLPPNFNDLSLNVHWKRNNHVLKSQSMRVHKGTAKFEETLMHQCSIYVTRSGSHDDVARYEPKHSLLYASIVGAPALDLGKHWIDLTRLLPVTLMELEDEKNRYGKWLTSFKLTGRAKGALINVSFGFSLSRVDFLGSRNVLKGGERSHNAMLHRLGSIPSNLNRRTHVLSPSFDMKTHNDFVPYRRSSSITFLYDLLDESKSSYSKELDLVSAELDCGEIDDGDYTVIDQGVEFPKKDELKIEEDSVKDFENSVIETINVADIFEGDEDAFNKEIECKTNGEVCGDLKEHESTIDESTIEELESFFHNLSTSGSPEFDFTIHENQFLDQDYYMNNKPSYEGGKLVESNSLDDFTDSIVNDFMDFVGSDSEPESPRERLLRQFEKESLVSGNFFSDFDSIEEQGDCSNSNPFDSSFRFQGAAIEQEEGVGSSLISRRKAKMLENLETEALMQEWGLNERAFQKSPRTSSGAFGSPVYLSPERPPELPPLGEGFGSFLKTKNGGFLRSMNPLLFKSAKNGEKLIMQVSKTVVLPASMGSNGMEVLQKWATVGAEKMMLRATQLMHLEEITGKTLQQVAWEAGLQVLERGHELAHELEVSNNLYKREEEAEELPKCICYDLDSEYISLGNITQIATEKIQYLLIEGLRIQSGMSNEEPPSSIYVKCTRENLADTSNNVKEDSSFESLENLDDIDEIIGMSISLEEWIMFYSSRSDDECEASIRVSNNLRKSSSMGSEMDLSRFTIYGKFSCQNHGFLDNNFTLAIQVLLRDPLRDYEPVGISMLVLIQVERVYDSGSLMFKIIEVYVTGFKDDAGKKQQSGSRWLRTSGIAGKTKKHSLSKSKSNAIVLSSSQSMNKAKHEAILWSISSYVHEAKLKALNLHVRNPDIVFE